jgi:hypothetical protein
VETDPAESISSAVLRVPGVAALTVGEFGRIQTYLAGRSVRGVRVNNSTVEVHVVVGYGIPIPAIADAIEAAATPFLNGRTLSIGIDDILLPGQGVGDDDLSVAG